MTVVMGMCRRPNLNKQIMMYHRVTPGQIYDKIDHDIVILEIIYFSEFLPT